MTTVLEVAVMILWHLESHAPDWKMCLDAIVMVVIVQKTLHVRQHVMEMIVIIMLLLAGNVAHLKTKWIAIVLVAMIAVLCNRTFMIFLTFKMLMISMTGPC